MPRPEKKKQHLINRYKQMVKELYQEGYDYPEIAVIINRDKSVICRIINSKNKT